MRMCDCVITFSFVDDFTSRMRMRILTIEDISKVTTMQSVL